MGLLASTPTWAQVGLLLLGFAEYRFWSAVLLLPQERQGESKG